VDIVIRDGWFAVDVVDDGVGIGSTTRRSGLDNLHRRAEESAGRFTVDAALGRGTHLTWTIPLID
jgi:signal transduction histidine kinase